MTRFDLEAAIMRCWSTADDLDMLADHVMEEDATVDDIVNTLIGIKQMHEIRMTKLWNVFAALVDAGQFVESKQPKCHYEDDCCGDDLDGD